MSATVAVDFDGVIHSYATSWQGHDVIPDPPNPGAIEWLNEIGSTYQLVIHTTRGETSGGRDAVTKWLEENGCVVDFKVTHEKVPALVYVDDRAWRFTGDNFPSAADIENALPWYKTVQDRSAA